MLYPNLQNEIEFMSYRRDPRVTMDILLEPRAYWYDICAKDSICFGTFNATPSSLSLRFASIQGPIRNKSAASEVGFLCSLFESLSFYAMRASRILGCPLPHLHERDYGWNM